MFNKQMKPVCTECMKRDMYFGVSLASFAQMLLRYRQPSKLQQPSPLAQEQHIHASPRTLTQGRHLNSFLLTVTTENKSHHKASSWSTLAAAVRFLLLAFLGAVLRVISPRMSSRPAGGSTSISFSSMSTRGTIARAKGMRMWRPLGAAGSSSLAGGCTLRTSCAPARLTYLLKHF